MNIIIKTKNIELDAYLEKFINEKIGKIGKFLSPDNQEIFVEIEKESNHHNKGVIFCAEIMIEMPGKKLMAAANLLAGEKVQVVNLHNGLRFETYVIKGKKNSGVIY